MITVVLRYKVNLGWNSRDVGVGESDVFADVAPVRIHERDVSTEQNTELKEKEIKTVFLSGSAGRDAAAALGQVAAKPKTRSIGVGDSKVYDLTDAAGESSVQVSQSNNNQVSRQWRRDDRPPPRRRQCDSRRMYVLPWTGPQSTHG